MEHHHHHPSTYEQFPAGQHDGGDESGYIPRPQTECGEHEPCERGADDVPAAHRPALPDDGERVEEGERNEGHSDRKADGVQEIVCGNADGAAADGAVGAPRFVAAVVPTPEGKAGAHSGPVDHASSSITLPAIVTESVAAFIEGIEGPGGCVARDPGDIAVGNSPIGRDQALQLARGPVRCRHRHEFRERKSCLPAAPANLSGSKGKG